MHGEYKEPGNKLVMVDLDTEDRKISKISIAGDFFLEPDDALDRYNRALTGMDADASVEQIVAALEAVSHPGDRLMGLSLTGIAIAVRRTLNKAVTWEDLHFEVLPGRVVSPEENIALDQVLVEEAIAGRRGPTLRIWEWDAPQIVIGSFQSYENEINPEGIQKHGIKVTRRITGGGAMFMEPGNCITYSLIVPTALVEGLNFVDSYAYLDQWVMGALAKLGIKAKYVPINDIASEKGKIAGAAQKRFTAGWTLHHVTMAYNIDAEKMMDCMRIGKEKIRDKGVRSAVKRVDPMRSQTGLPREEIIESFLQHFRGIYSTNDSALTDAEMQRAGELVKEKFRTEEWIHRVP